MLTIAPPLKIMYGVPPRLRTTQLNHLLTIFIQKIYMAIKGFQFYFARRMFMMKKAVNYHNHIK